MNQQDRTLYWLVITMVGLLVITPFFDYSFSTYLQSLPRGWAAFMEDSIYEGQPFGGGDISKIIQTLSLIIYLIVDPIPFLRHRFKYIKQLRYIIVTCIVIGFGMVHGLKNLTGRARPYLVNETANDIGFTHWFELGDLITKNYSDFGSFPSGHTTTAMILIVFVYAFKDVHKNKHLTAILTVAVLVYAIIMATARMVMIKHWLTDCIASIFFTWILAHIFYYKVFKLNKSHK